MNNTTSNN